MVVRVGVVGTSYWADPLTLPSLKSHPLAQLVSICGRNRERAEVADKYGIPRVFTSYHDVLLRGDLDALVVSTPDDLHHAITMAALDTGLHVLCEKPLASSATWTREKYETGEAKGVKYMVLFTYRWAPRFRYLYHLVQEGWVGRPFQAYNSPWATFETIRTCGGPTGAGPTGCWATWVRILSIWRDGISGMSRG